MQIPRIIYRKLMAEFKRSSQAAYTEGTVVHNVNSLARKEGLSDPEIDFFWKSSTELRVFSKLAHYSKERIASLQRTEEEDLELLVIGMLDDI